MLYKATYFILEAIILRVKFFWEERCNQFPYKCLTHGLNAASNKHQMGSSCPLSFVSSGNVHEYTIGRPCQVLGVLVGRVLFLRKHRVLGEGDGKETDKRMTKVINTVKEVCKQVL